MYCKQCGQPLNEKQAICMECGFKVGDGDFYCANCGHNITPEMTVCPNCQTSLIPPEPEYLNGKNKIMIAALALLLGNFGIHHFVMGETKKGFLKILLSLCCYISTVFSFIDFIKIVTDRYEVIPDDLF